MDFLQIKREETIQMFKVKLLHRQLQLKRHASMVSAGGNPGEETQSKPIHCTLLGRQILRYVFTFFIGHFFTGNFKCHSPIIKLVKNNMKCFALRF